MTDVDEGLGFEWFHICDGGDPRYDPKLREYGTLLCSMCRPHGNSTVFQTTREEFDKMRVNFQIKRLEKSQNSPKNID